MNVKFICIGLIVIFASGLILCGCNCTKKAKIVIRHESKYSKLVKKKLPSHVIDLSEDNGVDFNYDIGPQVPSGPKFNVITIDTP